jgi:hypothetical protein
MTLTTRISTLAVAWVLPLTSLAAQGGSGRFEITPFGSYHWGGSLGTDAFSTIPAGSIDEADSFSWGAILSFMASHNSAFEILYLRQDTDVSFNPVVGNTRNLGGFANNYIQFGGRADFGYGGEKALIPFFSAMIGMNVLDPKAGSLGSTTRWAWTLGAGARYKPEGNRLGVRFDARWLVTPVPSGSYGGWCDYWGCYAVQGTSWVGQGQLSGGLIIAF